MADLSLIAEKYLAQCLSPTNKNLKNHTLAISTIAVKEAFNKYFLAKSSRVLARFTTGCWKITIVKKFSRATKPTIIYSGKSLYDC